MCAPIEMFGIVNVISRLIPSQRPRPLSMRLRPRCRATITAAPMSPNTAPEAPTDGPCDTISTPSEPQNSATK